MNHLRYYLRWFNTTPTWMVYAARDQNLSVPIDSSVSCPQLAEDGSRGGHPRLTYIDRDGVERISHGLGNTKR